MIENSQKRQIKTAAKLCKQPNKIDTVERDQIFYTIIKQLIVRENG